MPEMRNGEAGSMVRPGILRRLLVLACLVIATPAFAESTVDYSRDIKPILTKRCYACHGALKQQSGLRLDAAQLIRRGGDSGEIIVPGNPEESWIIDVLTGDAGFRMPPEGNGKQLSGKEIDLFRAWIIEGAKAPQQEKAPEDPRKHWSFQSPLRPNVPQIKNNEWPRNPVDAFIAAEHEKRGLIPRPPADKAMLLRRVYLDLIGLPPTREQLLAFLNDSSATAYEKVVDRLLDSPRYGERWGRHWMDVWRYSDWYGQRKANDIRYSQYHIWRWRDWIVESLNADKGYDRMIVEMLAGDEVAPDDPDTLRATGYLARNWYKFNRNTWLQETVEHTGMGFLAITLKCTRCHDHKFDPITQTEYYRFRAFFEPHDVRTERLPGEADLTKNGLARVFDKQIDAPTYLFVRGDDRKPDKEHPLSPGVPSALGNLDLKIDVVSLPIESYYPAIQPFVVKETLAAAKAEVQAVEAALLKSKAAVASANKEPATSTGNADGEVAFQTALADIALNEKKLLTARAELKSVQARVAADLAKYGIAPQENMETAAKVAAKAQRQANLVKAEYQIMVAGRELVAVHRSLQPDEILSTQQTDRDKQSKKKIAAAQKALESAQAALESLQQEDAGYSPLGESYPKTSTGRRSALARWIANPKNPRTARVAVNHIWLRHFGTAIVSSVADFGLRSKPRSHPELLDWLAVELTENHWSMKHLHRLIVTSATYRMKSSAGGSDHPNLDIDPENRYLWRMNSRRMEAEIVRDSILHVAGRLDTTMGGPDIDEKLGQTSRRRSLYFRHTPDSTMEFLDLFDLANPNQCYQRRESVVPQQALAMTNSGVALIQARLLARDLSQQLAVEESDEMDAAFITAAFQQVLSRQPSATEVAVSQRFLRHHAELLSRHAELSALPSGKVESVKPSSNPALRARENFVHVLLNHNNFVTIR